MKVSQGDGGGEFGVVVEADDAVVDGEVGGGGFGPAAGVIVGDGLIGGGLDGFSVVGVSADDGAAVETGGELAGAIADFVGATDEDFGFAFGEAGDVVGAVDFLEEEIGEVGDPGEDGVVFDEVVEGVAVDDEDGFFAGGENVLFDHADAEEVRDDIGGAVVVAGDPDDVNLVGKVADLRKHFPVGLFEPAEVDGVEDVAVDDELACAEVAVEEALEEVGDGFGLAIFRAEVEVGDDDGVEG